MRDTLHAKLAVTGVMRWWRWLRKRSVFGPIAGLFANEGFLSHSEPAATSSRRPLEPDSNLLEVESATVLELRSSAGAGKAILRCSQQGARRGCLSRFSLALWSYPPRPGFATFLCRLWLSGIYSG